MEGMPRYAPHAARLSHKYTLRESVEEVFNHYGLDVDTASLDEMVDVALYVLVLTKRREHYDFRLRHDLRYFVMVANAWKKKESADRMSHGENPANSASRRHDS